MFCWFLLGNRSYQFIFSRRYFSPIVRREREIGVITKDSRLCKVTFLGDVFDVAVLVVDRKVTSIYIKAAINC